MISEEERLAESIFNNFKRDYLFYFSRLLNRVMVEPDMLQIMLTSKCNIRCKICDVWKQKYENEMTTEVVKNLIDQAIDGGVKTVYFTGGEALLREDIFELINYASRPGIITTVNTNGSLINDEIAKKIVLSKLRNITFSIDSITPELHNFIRGKNIFEKAMKGIEFINYYKKKFNREDKDVEEGRLDVGMVSVIMKYNLGELPKIVYLAKKMHCCYIAFQPLVYNGSLLENVNFKSDFLIQEDDILKLRKVFIELESMKRNIPGEIFIDFMPEKTIQYFQRKKGTNSCFAGFSRIFVNPQGDISFVCFEPLGNIRQNSLKEVWESEKAYLIREKIKECKVNCTQFCSERPQSESINLIHNRFIKEIENLPLLIQNITLKEEHHFLQSVIEEIGSGSRKKNGEIKIKKILDKLENIIVQQNNL